MVRINDISKAMAFLEETIKESGNIEADCSPELQAELAEQKKHFAVIYEVLRLFLAEPETSLALYKKSIEGHR